MSDAIPTSFDTEINATHKDRIQKTESKLSDFVSECSVNIASDLDIDCVANEAAFRTQRNLGGGGLAYA